MSRHPELVYDIECVGSPEWSELDEQTRTYLTKRSADQLARDGVDGIDPEERAAGRLALELGLQKVVAIAMANVETGDVAVLLEQHGNAVERNSSPRVIPCEERTMLRRWWSWMPKYGRLVTFNGRGYDAPVLMVRSAQLQVACTRQLCGYRYDIEDHCDIADVLTWHGSVRSQYGVDYWCRRFGIESPKDAGVDGSQVAELYAAGDMMAIAEYAARDVTAERALYLRLRASFAYLFKGGPALELEQPQLALESA